MTGPRSQLERLVEALKDSGLTEAAGRLEKLLATLDDSLRSVSWFSRKRQKLTAVLKRQLRYAESEIKETAHLLNVAKSIVEQRPVSDEDKELARSQFLDVLKAVPASAVLAGTFMIPLPGAQPILAPLLMEKLGLLPSAWSETEMEKELHDLVEVSSNCGLADVASGLQDVLSALMAENKKVDELAEFIQRNPQWSVFFDENLDQKVSRPELKSLRRRIQITAVEARCAADTKDWYVFLSTNGHFSPEQTSEFRLEHSGDTVAGPYTFSVIISRFQDPVRVLVRRSTEGWWVPLGHVLNEMDIETHERTQEKK